MWRPAFILLVALTGLASCNPIGRQVGFSADVGVTSINKTAVCVVDGILYTEGQSLPTADPCEECQCRPPGFACVTVKCPVKPQCQAFQEEGQCCPTYSCGCQKDGVEIPEGEAVKDPRNPCESCVCKGGEIVCAVDSCPWRDDCEGRYTPGVCCPSYDHCPATDSGSELFVLDQKQTEGEEPTAAPDSAIREGGEGEGLTVAPEASEAVTQPSELETGTNETPVEANEAVNEASGDAAQESVETQTETRNDVQSENNEENTESSVRQSETETYTTENPELINLKLEETQPETLEVVTETSDTVKREVDAETQTQANEAQNEDSNNNTETPIEANEAEVTTVPPAGDAEVRNRGNEVVSQMLPQASNILPHIVDALTDTRETATTEANESQTDPNLKADDAVTEEPTGIRETQTDEIEVANRVNEDGTEAPEAQTEATVILREGEPSQANTEVPQEANEAVTVSRVAEDEAITGASEAATQPSVERESETGTDAPVEVQDADPEAQTQSPNTEVPEERNEENAEAQTEPPKEEIPAERNEENTDSQTEPPVTEVPSERNEENPGAQTEVPSLLAEGNQENPEAQTELPKTEVPAERNEENPQTNTEAQTEPSIIELSEAPVEANEANAEAQTEPPKEEIPAERNEENTDTPTESPNAEIPAERNEENTEAQTKPPIIETPEAPVEANEANIEAQTDQPYIEVPEAAGDTQVGTIKEETTTEPQEDSKTSGTVHISVNGETLQKDEPAGGKEQKKPAVNMEDEMYWINMKQDDPSNTEGDADALGDTTRHSTFTDQGEREEEEEVEDEVTVVEEAPQSVSFNAEREFLGEEELDEEEEEEEEQFDDRSFF